MKWLLSALARPDIIQDLESTTFDLLVIGGGITGAAVAWDAAKRGIKTAVIDQGDFGWGSSSKSSKMIHNGLRYLEKGRFKLVRSTGKEREWLYRNAPHLLAPTPVLLPIYKNGSYKWRSTALGLYVYDRLAGTKRSQRSVMHSKEEAVRIEPLLSQQGLKGAALYHEYRTNDARLTIEVLKTAVRHGAWAVNYLRATEFIYYKSKVCGIKAVDLATGAEVQIRAKRIVNSAGSWGDLLRSKDHALKEQKLRLSKGVHLVVDHGRLPVRQPAYFDAPDGRRLFAVPWQGKTCIGPTESLFTGDPDKPRVTEEERDYLLNAVNEAFPYMNLTAADVEAMWAAVRPRIADKKRDNSGSLSKDELWESVSGLITVAGGNITGFRALAEKTVDLVADSLKKEERRQDYAPCTTEREVLSGGDTGRCDTFEDLKEELLQLAIRKKIPAAQASYLLNQYGSNTAEILMRLEGAADRTDQQRKERDAAGFGLLQAADESDKTRRGLSASVAAAGSHASSAPTATVASSASSVVDKLDVRSWKPGIMSGQEEILAGRGSTAVGTAAAELTEAQEVGGALETAEAVEGGEARQGGEAQQNSESWKTREARPNSEELQPGEDARQTVNAEAAAASLEAVEEELQAVGQAAIEEDEGVPDALTPIEYKVLEAEVRYCIEEEMTLHAADFLERRTGLLYFDRERAEQIAVYVIEIMAKELGWDEAAIMEQKLKLAADWEAATKVIHQGNDMSGWSDSQQTVEHSSVEVETEAEATAEPELP